MGMESAAFTSEFERASCVADAIRARSGVPPQALLVLGSGLGSWADRITDATAIPYGDLPHLPRSTVAGHAGRLVMGRCHGISVAAMQGRAHMYEGHSAEEVVRCLRALRILGAETLVVTNAAGGIAERLRAGDLMLLSDHLNLTGRSPLVGPAEPRFGPRFPDMSVAYDPRLRAVARDIAGERGIALHEGVYAGLLGPTYETPAEVQMLRRMGADAVGMSTVAETIAAVHMGMRVLGISCITNLAAGLSHQKLDHREVQETADRVRGQFEALLDGVVARLAQEAM